MSMLASHKTTVLFATELVINGRAEDCLDEVAGMGGSRKSAPGGRAGSGGGQGGK